MAKKSIAQIIEESLDGRTQRSVLNKMKAKGAVINDVQFTRKKNGAAMFTEKEIKLLKEILGVEISYDI
jgi:hypothetical protein